MKNILFILLVVLSSCSKNTSEEPPSAISFTQTRRMYDVKNNYEGTLNVIHFHRVDDPALIRQYKKLPALQAFCDDPTDTLVTVLARPCLEDCVLK